MSKQKLYEMGDDAGIPASDVDRMFHNGLTHAMVSMFITKLGLSFLAVREIFFKYGPSSLLVMNDIASRVQK